MEQEEGEGPKELKSIQYKDEDDESFMEDKAGMFTYHVIILCQVIQCFGVFFLQSFERRLLKTLVEKGWEMEEMLVVTNQSFFFLIPTMSLKKDMSTI